MLKVYMEDFKLSKAGGHYWQNIQPEGSEVKIDEDGREYYEVDENDARGIPIIVAIDSERGKQIASFFARQKKKKKKG